MTNEVQTFLGLARLAGVAQMHVQAERAGIDLRGTDVNEFAQ
jgi:hypothetical protein